MKITIKLKFVQTIFVTLQKNINMLHYTMYKINKLNLAHFSQFFTLKLRPWNSNTELLGRDPRHLLRLMGRAPRVQLTKTYSD